MLVLSRKVGERIQIGDDVTIVIGRVHNQSVKIGIEAPVDRPIVRCELLEPASQETYRPLATLSS